MFVFLSTCFSSICIKTVMQSGNVLTVTSIRQTCVCVIVKVKVMCNTLAKL